MRRAAATLLLLFITALTLSAGGDDYLPPASGPAAEGYDLGNVRERLADRALDRIEGIWQLVPDGAVVVVEKVREGIDEARTGLVYSIRSISSPDRSLRPGTLVGRIRAGGHPDTFEARFYTRREGMSYTRPVTVTAGLDDKNGRLEFRRHKSSLRINLWHFVPFLWRYSLRYHPDEHNYAPGAVRVFPRPALPTEPVYL